MRVDHAIAISGAALDSQSLRLSPWFSEVVKKLNLDLGYYANS